MLLWNKKPVEFALSDIDDIAVKSDVDGLSGAAIHHSVLHRRTGEITVLTTERSQGRRRNGEKAAWIYWTVGFRSKTVTAGLPLLCGYDEFLTRCLLMADIVAKVENRTTQKISRKLIFGLLCCRVAFQRHYGGP
jgi:hypothetical protein